MSAGEWGLCPSGSSRRAAADEGAGGRKRGSWLVLGRTGGRAASSDLDWIVAGAIFDVLAFIALLVTALFMAFRAMNAEPGVRKFYYM